MPSGIATNRTNITLPADISQEIWQKTQEASAVMRLARRVPLPGRGVQIPVITADPQAGWVDETGLKPVSNPTLSTKLLQPYKIAVIVPFSNEFRRDLRSLYDAIVARLPNALGLTFDKTVIGATDKPGENFDNMALCTGQSLIATVSPAHTTYDALVAAHTDIAEHQGNLDAFALSPAAEGILLGAVDTTGRPLFVNSAAEGAVPRIMGARTVTSRGLYKAGSAAAESTPAVPAVVGVAGDWTQAVYGTVEGVVIDVSDQTGLTINSNQVNLWEHNMFAVRAEIEVGFRCDTSVFNRLLGAAPSGS